MPRYLPLKLTTFRWGSPFGRRESGMHYGQDFAANDGVQIFAAEDGAVEYIGAAQGFGQWIVLRHPSGQRTVYGHMWNAFATGLKVGSEVKGGQVIGYVGSNGQSSGPHLHFEVHPGAWRAGSQIDPKPWLTNAINPGPPPAVDNGPAKAQMADPFTGELWSPNRYSPRGAPNPRWIAIHTQEARSTARGLGGFTAQKSSQVAYHVVVDDREILKTVAEGDAPWSAAGANRYAFHVCGAGTFAGWSRGKWLETDASDGLNEDLVLTNLAKVVAWWSLKYRIPLVWIGGRNVPPWGHDGVCGHRDFGQWGGGHTDPGNNFPHDELLRRASLFAGGTTPAPLPAPTPLPQPGSEPGKFTEVMLFRNKIGIDREQVKAVQRRLKAAYASYAGHLAVDGDYGPQTEAAVREFQRRSGIWVDGIVGPMTAAALRPW